MQQKETAMRATVTIRTEDDGFVVETTRSALCIGGALGSALRDHRDCMTDDELLVLAEAVDDTGGDDSDPLETAFVEAARAFAKRNKRAS